MLGSMLSERPLRDTVRAGWYPMGHQEACAPPARLDHPGPNRHAADSGTSLNHPSVDDQAMTHPRAASAGDSPGGQGHPGPGRQHNQK